MNEDDFLYVAVWNTLFVYLGLVGAYWVFVA